MAEKPPVSARRDARLEQSEDRNSRRVALAVSSEKPVERWYGLEVLDHAPNSVDLSFFGSGRAPLLHNHNSDAQIGVVESARLDNDGVLRAVVRFGNSALADEVLADVRDGIRCNTSVGYDISEYEPLPTGDGYRVTGWQPLEVSIVAIPADKTVGVGRSKHRSNVMLDDHENDPNPGRTAKAAKDGAYAERERVAAILDLGERHNQRTAAQRAIADGTSLPDFRGLIVAALPAVKPIVSAPALHLGAERQGSIMALIRSQIDGRRTGAEYELDVVAEMTEQARKAHVRQRGLMVPFGWLAGGAETRSAKTTANLAGMQSVDHLGGDFVGPLRAASRVLELGAQLRPLVYDADIPNWSVGASVAWVNEGSAPANSDPVTGTIPLRWHGLSSTFNATRRAIYQSDPELESTFRADAMIAIGTEVDRAAIQGTGTAPEPKGILATSGIASVAMGANGGAVTWPAVVALRKAVRQTGVIGNNWGWLGTFGVEAAMLTVEKSSGSGRFILEDNTADDPRIALDRCRFSANVPSNGTKGTHTTADLSSLIYAEWSHLIIAAFAGVDVIVDPYTESAAGNIRISLHTAWDFALKHPEAFGAIRDIATN